jgi:hypothetical protein
VENVHTIPTKAAMRSRANFDFIVRPTRSGYTRVFTGRV